MDGINALKHKIRRLLKKSSSYEDVGKNPELGDHEERKCVKWTVENIFACPLVNGEYLESPPFFCGHSNNTKWTLRLYPRGRDPTHLGQVGLFVSRISPPVGCCSVNYEFKLMDPCPVEAYFWNQSDLGNLDECGTDEFLSVKDLSNVKLLKIECNMLVACFDEAKDCHTSEEGFPNCTCASLSKDLRSLYDQQKHTDAILKIREVNIPVHKAILGARSKKFSAMFKEDKKRGPSSGVTSIEIIQSTFDEYVIRDLVEFIYTDTVDNLTFTKALSLYPVARNYSMKKLKKLCADKILATMSVENFCHIAGLANIQQCAKVKLATKKFFCNHSAQILHREDWEKFILERGCTASELMGALASEIKAKSSVTETMTDEQI